MIAKVLTPRFRPRPWVDFIDLLERQLGEATRVRASDGYTLLGYRWPGIYLDVREADYDLWSFAGPAEELWFMVNAPSGWEAV